MPPPSARCPASQAVISTATATTLGSWKPTSGQQNRLPLVRQALRLARGSQEGGWGVPRVEAVGGGGVTVSVQSRERALYSWPSKCQVVIIITI